MAIFGLRQIPIGFTYNKTLFNRINNWKHNFSDAILFLRHEQSWNTYMFKIGDYDKNSGNVSFSAGGWQGGRNMPSASSTATSNQPIQTGTFYISGILDELDVVNEWYFDKNDNTLYYYPDNTGKPNHDLVIGNLSCLFRLVSDDHTKPLMNVTFNNIIFQNTRYTYIDEQRWGVPSLVSIIHVFIMI